MTPPKWLTGEQQREWWEKPWTVPQRSSEARDFKLVLWQHGLVSPHFTRREAGGQDRNPQFGTAVPDGLRHQCQFHAFGLERVRHELGDKPLGPDGWFRNERHNNAVGGASASEHMEAWATDWFPATRARHGGEHFDRAMERAFANGGRGYQSTVGGPIRHVDNGAKRVWVYA